jgi:hypothetical protein
MVRRIDMGKCLVCGEIVSICYNEYYMVFDISKHMHPGHPRSVFNSKGELKNRQDLLNTDKLIDSES